MSKEESGRPEPPQNLFQKWVDEGPGERPAPVLAATAILLRDAAEGLETLLLRRNSKLAFGGMWVFPGGRLDPEDWKGLSKEDVLGASRRASVREAEEEAGLEIDESLLVPYSHWTPPPIAPRQFLTWFFVVPAPEGQVKIDRGEIHDSDWMRPADALRRRDAGEIELVPPTIVTLSELCGYSDVAGAMQGARDREPEVFATRVGRVEGGVTAMWHGDAGYDDGDAERPGARHRLSMLESGWRYERTC